ncbi:hypothetical protein D3C71_1920180 [compost metagenome]
MKGRTAASGNFIALTIASTIGVRIKAAPSLAKKAETAAPSRITYMNISFPLPLASFAMWRADHSKNPMLSSTMEMIIMPTKASVAFQTMSVTVATSWKDTT